MTQASETPEQKRDEKQGSSRRSAASAKPATQAAASVYTPKRTAKAKEPKKPFEGLKKKLTEEQKPKTKAEKRELERKQSGFGVDCLHLLVFCAILLLDSVDVINAEWQNITIIDSIYDGIGVQLITKGLLGGT